MLPRSVIFVFYILLYSFIWTFFVLLLVCQPGTQKKKKNSISSWKLVHSFLQQIGFSSYIQLLIFQYYPFHIIWKKLTKSKKNWGIFKKWDYDNFFFLLWFRKKRNLPVFAEMALTLKTTVCSFILNKYQN